MEKDFKVFYVSADEARTEIFNNLKKKHPFLKFWELCKRYSPWDISLCSDNWFKIKGRLGVYQSRFLDSKTLEVLARFDNFSEMGIFLDRITRDKNAVIDYDEKEAWKLSSADTTDILFGEDSKNCEISVIYKLAE